MIVPPRRPTRDRLKAFDNKRHSYWRALTYEAVGSIELKGRALDFGGGADAGYVHLLRGAAIIDSLNIDARLRPTILHDANKPFPIEDRTYDSLISLNTLEHIFRDEFALAELVRILKPGGELHILVPFMYRVHASPSDYHRHTAFWWEEALARLGVDASRSRIEPIMWGRLTTAFSFVEFSRLRFLRRLPLWADMLVTGAADAEYPLGYYIKARK